MGIARSVVEALRDTGFDSVHLLEEGLERMPDGAILDKARAEGRIILTHDLDFGDLLASGALTSPSVITFRLSDMRGHRVLDHLMAALPQFQSELEAGACVTITEGKARCRSLPVTRTNF
jgi:predicted nuclease of predicted toxin-antitoxin system